MKTIKPVYFVVVLTIVSVALFFLTKNIYAIHHQTRIENGKHYYSVETFDTGDNGWGYQIFRGDKLIIKQDIIPAIQNSIPFQSEKDANKTGQLVVEKLTHKKLPSVSVFELDSLHVEHPVFDIRF